MRSVKATFKKQIKDLAKNTSVLVQFIIFPVVAFAMTELIARGDDNIPDTMFTTMMAAVFVGMSLIPTVAGIIAEDREKKSLRFLVMAGVKPTSYLLGVGGVIFIVSLLPATAFSIIGGFRGVEFGIFMSVMMSGVVASILLGSTIGIFAKNQQAATGLAMPIAMVLGFGPIAAGFNEQVERIFSIFYTQQLNVVIDSFYTISGYHSEMALWQPFAIIWGNVAVLTVLFILAYTKKGLKG